MENRRRVFSGKGKMTKDKEIKDILEKGLFKGDIMFNERMSAHTSLKIGGPVDIMVVPEDPISLKIVLTAASRGKVPVFVIGGGTNLLVGDGEIEGIAISLKAFNQIEKTRETDESHIGLYIGAGVPLASVVGLARKNGYSGIETLVGIPGHFGGAVSMNAGSFGTEIKDVIMSVAVMNMHGEILVLNKDEINFSYRSSNLPEGAVILSANILLKKDLPEEIEKRALEFLDRKRAAQPLGEASAGCIFKNPTGDSAGRLIDAAGCKGDRAGNVEVNEKHANFFINKGNAECRDFYKLMEKVKSKVKKQSSIELEPEIKIIDSA